jgi:hypothetical protein
MAGSLLFGVDVFNQVLAWRVTGQITPSEVQSLAAQVSRATLSLRAGRIKLLQDYRSMSEDGQPLAFKDDVNEELGKLEDWLIAHCSHMAVLCNTSAMKAEWDRLIAQRDRENVMRAFYNPDRATALRQAYAFLGIEGNEVVAA